MSTEETTPTPEATTENVAPVTPEEKSEVNTVPSYRLKEEADKRRAAEAKLAEFEKAEQARKDEELSFKERYDKVSNEFESFKTNVERDKLKNEFVSKAVELGFPIKIAKLGAPNDLSEDNMKDNLKTFTKEFSEFLPQKEEPKPVNPFAAVQPAASVAETKTFTPGHIKGSDAVNSLLNS